MKVEIESIICNFSSKTLNNPWAGEIPHILVRVLNAITLSSNNEELKDAINKIAEDTELNNFFAYGYGALTFGSPIADYLMVSR